MSEKAINTFNTVEAVNIFISHSWKYSGHYDIMHSWLSESNKFIFNDYSVPQDNPVHYADSDKELEEAILRKISISNVVVIPTGMYASYSKWIRKEIDNSKIYKKPILAVNPWAQIRGSGVVKKKASKVVGWDRQNVEEGILELYNKHK